MKLIYEYGYAYSVRGPYVRADDCDGIHFGKSDVPFWWLDHEDETPVMCFDTFCEALCELVEDTAVPDRLEPSERREALAEALFGDDIGRPK